MPGSLLLAVPFVLLGNAAWQNIFWCAAYFVVATARHRRHHMGARAGLAAARGVPDHPSGPRDRRRPVGEQRRGSLRDSRSCWRSLTARRGRESLCWRPCWSASRFPPASVSCCWCRSSTQELVRPESESAGQQPLSWSQDVSLSRPRCRSISTTRPGSPRSPSRTSSRNSATTRRRRIVLLPTLCVGFSVFVTAWPGPRGSAPWLVRAGLILLMPAVLLVVLVSIRGEGILFRSSACTIPAALFGTLGVVAGSVRANVNCR